MSQVIVDPFKVAKTTALQILSRRNYHSLELVEKLEEKLIEKGLSAEQIEESIPLVLENLKEVSILNDESAVESEIRKGIRGLKGPVYIAFRLKNKGVSREEITLALKEFYPETLRKEVILKLLEKKGGADRNKKIAAAVRAGFSVSEVLSLAKR